MPLRSRRSPFIFAGIALLGVTWIGDSARAADVETLAQVVRTLGLEASPAKLGHIADKLRDLPQTLLEKRLGGGRP